MICITRSIEAREAFLEVVELIFLHDFAIEWEEIEEIGDVENLDETSYCVHVTCRAMPDAAK